MSLIEISLSQKLALMDEGVRDRVLALARNPSTTHLVYFENYMVDYSHFARAASWLSVPLTRSSRPRTWRASGCATCRLSGSIHCSGARRKSPTPAPRIGARCTGVESATDGARQVTEAFTFGNGFTAAM